MLAKTKENDVIDRLLDAEMDEHLGYKKNDNAGDNSGNSRNGYTTESVMADVREWQNRPLEKSYPILFLNALRVNSRQERQQSPLCGPDNQLGRQKRGIGPLACRH